MISQDNSQTKDNISFSGWKELCRVLCQQASEGVFVADKQGLIVEVNQHLCAMLGYTRAELLRLSMGEIVLHRDTRQPIDYNAHTDNTDSPPEQYFFCRKDSTLLEVRLRLQGFAEGHMLGLVCNLEKSVQMEERLSESEERFRLLSESSLAGVYLIQDGRFVYVNQSFAQMFGYEAEEVVDHFNTTDLVFPDDRPLVLDNIAQRLNAKKSSVRYVFRGLRKNGSVIYVEVHGNRIVYRGKVGVIGTLVDITEAKKTEAALRASEERYRALYNDNPSMFFTLSNEGIVVAVNDFGARQLGYAEGELQGQPFLNLLAADEREIAMERFNACLQSPGKVHHWQFRKVRKDGSLMWAEEYLRAVTWPDGKVYVLAVCQDITERKQLEESLQTSQFIFDQASIAIFLIEDDSRIVNVNDYACRSLGYTKKELCDLSLLDLDPVITRDQLAQLKNQLNAQQSTTIKTTHQRKNGETFPVQIFISTLPHKNKVLRVSFVQDISEIEQARIAQEKLETQFKQVQKIEAVGRLAGGVAHDLNNLLTPILGYSDLLILDESIRESTKEKLTFINRAAVGARDLIKKLLAFSRKQILEYQSLDINRIVKDFDGLIRRTIRENIEINISISNDIQPVMADKGQIEQVLMNLVVNASDAMPNGGKLSIETKTIELDQVYTATHPDVIPGTYVMLGISDTGEGMDELTLSKIFEPFFSTKGEQGTGLGLATVYGIVKQHKGSIWVYSERGIGTIFKVYLPIAKFMPEPARATYEKKPKPRGTETILLVEDNEAVRTTVYDILKEQGYRVLAAQDGQSALLTVSSGIHFDLLLTDVVMPGMNGKDLFIEISTQNPSVKVLYMSGYTDDIIMHHDVLENGVRFIQKPFNSGEILEKVRSVLDS
jgi:PAS domain S-box-containing protein